MIKRIIDKYTQLFIRDDFTYDESTEIGLDVAPAQGFYWPKCDGQQWIEGRTAEKIAEILVNQPVPEPTVQEQLDVLFGGAV